MTSSGALQRYKNTNRILDMVSDTMSQSFLRKQKTREYQKAQFKKTGILDSDVLFKYKISDDLFIRKQIDHTGKSYGFIMLLDMSGSMSNIYLQSVIQIILLAKFCRKIGVPFDIYGFSDAGCSWAAGRRHDNSPKLLHFFSSKATKPDFDEHCKAFYLLAESATGGYRSGHYSSGYTLGGTPLNNALYSTFSVIEDFDSKYNRDVNHLIVLTDGQPSDSVFEKNADNTFTPYRDIDNQISILKVKNKSYVYNQKDFHNKIKKDANLPHDLVRQRPEQYFLISCLKKHFGPKLKCHRFYIDSSSFFVHGGEATELITTKKINSPIFYDTDTNISDKVFKCFGNIFNSNFWEDETPINTDVSIAKQMSKIGRQMEKTLTKTKELRTISEKIVDLLVET